MLAAFRISLSNKPKVLGFVNIKAAVFSEQILSKIPISSKPFLLFKLTTLNPAKDAEAGFVPWLESGIITSCRWNSFLSKKIF